MKRGRTGITVGETNKRDEAEMRKKYIWMAMKMKESDKTNEEISFEFSIYEYSSYVGGYTGSTASFKSSFDLTHI